MAGSKNVFATKEELQSKYKEFQSIYKIADFYNVNPKTVIALMDTYNIARNKHSIGNRRHFYDENYFKVIDTEEKAYWLGFIYADGCIYKGSDANSLRLQINLAEKDEDILVKFQRAIGSDYKIQHKEVNKSIAVFLKINSTIMCNDLMSHGVKHRKSLVCTYPKQSVSDYLRRHFIRGYFDGDGSIGYYYFKSDNRYRPSFSIVGGKEMMEDIQQSLNGTHLYKLKNREHISTLETGSHKTIEFIYHYFYDDATIYMQRKKDIFTEIISMSH